MMLINNVFLLYFISISFRIGRNVQSFVEARDTEVRAAVQGTVLQRLAKKSLSFPKNWLLNTRIEVNGGQFLGFLKRNGSFTVHNLPVGSHILEVVNPDFIFDQIRLDINRDGKVRARKANFIKTSDVELVSLPLKLEPQSQAHYFQERVEWKFLDFMMNPIVMMIGVVVVTLLVLPNLLDDEMKEEIEKVGQYFEVPKMSDVIGKLVLKSSSRAENAKINSAKKVVRGKRK